MSLEYYLSTRKKTNDIINNLNSVINNMSALYYDTMYEKEYDDKNKLYRNPVFLNCINNNDNIKELLKSAENCKVWCDDCINKLCRHEYVNDTIDINPERSQNITYCKICEYTIPN